MGYTPLAYCVIRKLYDKVKMLLNSKFNLMQSFNQRDKDGRTLLMLATFSSFEILTELMQSKYVVENPCLMKDVDRNGHNVPVYMVVQSLEMTMYLLQSPYWTNDVKYHKDIDGDSFLVYPYGNPNTVQFLLYSENCDLKMAEMTNDYHMNIAHCYAERNAESFAHLLASPLCNKNMLQKKDIFGNIPLHIASKTNSMAAETLIRSALFDPETMVIQDRDMKNAFMLSLETDVTFAKLLWSTGYVNINVLSQDDLSGCTSLHYVARYSSSLLQCIMESGMVTEELYNYRNKDMMTPIIYAAQYNGSSVEYLIKSPLCSNVALYKLHSDYGSALTVAARYQPDAIKHILNYKDLSDKIIYAMETGQNFMTIACTYQPLAVKYAIESDRDLSRFICSPSTNIIIAAKYQPMAVKYILDSKYGNPNIFFIKNEDNMNCIEMAHLFQPKALWFIIDSKHATHDIINQENHRGYRLLSILQLEYPGFKKFEDLKNNPLINEENVIASENDSNACGICFEFQTRIFFWPCCHAVCVGCAFKEKICHICRTNIDSRHVIRA
jgi:ankyrin repeat protein